MVTLNHAAEAWIRLGRAMYPSLAEVEQALTSREHTDATPPDPPPTEEDR